MTSIRLDERVAIVTDATNAVGQCLVTALSQHGAKIVIAASASQSGKDVDRITNDIIAAGGEAVAFHAATGAEDTLLECALDNFGSLDIVISNLTDLSTTTPNGDWRNHFLAPLQRATHISRAVWPYLLEHQFGRIGFVTSDPYLATGLTGLSQALSAAGQAHNINANTISLVTPLTPQTENNVAALAAHLCNEHNTLAGGHLLARSNWIGQLQCQPNTGLTLSHGDTACAELLAQHWTDVST